MVVSHTRTFELEDLKAVLITCNGCGASVSLPLAKTKSFEAKRDCTVCERPLWRGGDDTAFVRALIAARIGKSTRFALVVDEP